MALVCASCASSAAKSSQPARHRATSPTRTSDATVLRTFHPYDVTGRLVAPVARHTSGTCWTTSIAAAAPTAFRCQAGNEILDPCFGHTSTATTLACAQDPWTPVTVLRVTAPLPPDASMGASVRPWALVLADGARCVALTGTVPMIAGVSLDYSCQDGTAATVPNPRAHIIDARVGRPGGTVLRTVRVATIWRG